MTSHSKLLNAALVYADMGYAVFPCRPGTKIPATDNGYKDATTDPEQLEKWWAETPRANIGMPTEGMLVVDKDGSHNPWLKNDPDLAMDLVGCPTQITPREGNHLIFADPEKKFRNTTSRLAPNVDTRASGGYILVAPSIVNSKPYRWVVELCALEELSSPPQWLADFLHSKESDKTVNPGGENDIPPGQRNSTLAELAGTMRRVGMGVEEILGALVATNKNRCKPPVPDKEVARIASSVARYEPDQVAVAVIENHWGQDAATSMPPSIGDLMDMKLQLRRPVIHGLLRVGETMNVIAPPKTGKSWLVNDLAIAVATGQSWLGIFQCTKGNVLICDNELHQETSANRLPRVMEARGVHPRQVADRIYVDNLRGRLQDLLSMKAYFARFEPGQFDMIVLDAFYRFLPKGTDENDNGAMANLYNFLDMVAGRLKSSFVNVHHSSKGNQSGKDVTDVGAGAGSQARATDTHLILRRHEEEDVVVLDAAVRSWPPVEPVCLRWTFPIWTPDHALDPNDLKHEGRHKKEDPALAWDHERFLELWPKQEDPVLLDSVAITASKQGLKARSFTQYLETAVAHGQIFPWFENEKRRKNAKAKHYSIHPQPHEPEAEAGLEPQAPRPETLTDRILAMADATPELSNKAISEALECPDGTVRRVRNRIKNERDKRDKKRDNSQENGTTVPKSGTTGQP